MLDPHAIKAKINELFAEYHVALQELQFKVLDGEEHDLELHRCQSLVAEIAELDKYLTAFNSIKEEEE